MRCGGGRAALRIFLLKRTEVERIRRRSKEESIEHLKEKKKKRGSGGGKVLRLQERMLSFGEDGEIVDVQKDICPPPNWKKRFRKRGKENRKGGKKKTWQFYLRGSHLDQSHPFEEGRKDLVPRKDPFNPEGQNRIYKDTASTLSCDLSIKWGEKRCVRGGQLSAALGWLEYGGGKRIRCAPAGGK